MGFIRPHTMRAWFGPQQYENVDQLKRDSFPTGTNPHYSIVLGDYGALLSSTTTSTGSSSFSAGVAMGRAVEAALSGTASLTVNASLVVQMAAALLGQASLTTSLSGAVSMAASLAGSGNITAALGLISNVVATLIGAATVSPTLRGTAKIEANIFTNEGAADAAQIATSVWNSLAASFNDPGTMGEALNDAAAGGGGGGGGGTIIRDDELAQGGTKAQITLNAAASTTDNLYEEAYIVLISGTGAGQVRKIKAYYGATRTCVVWNHFQVAPDNTTVYRIIP